MNEVVSIIIIVFGLLQIILFFKVWAMTNDVKNILGVLNSKDAREANLPKKAKVRGNDTVMEVLGLKNGKVLCRTHYSNSSSDDLYNIDRLEFLTD